MKYTCLLPTNEKRGAAEHAISSSVCLAVRMQRAPDRLAAWSDLRAGIPPKRVATNVLNLPELPNKAVDVVVGFRMLREKERVRMTARRAADSMTDRMLRGYRESELG